MELRTRWSTDDYDDMSWHDVHVHGFRILRNDGDNGTAEVIFDIDYILEWVKDGARFSFVVAQASLRSHEVFGLKITLDYAAPTAGMCAFSLDGIERELVVNPRGHASYRWKMPINWPSGLIEFSSPGFTQALVGPRYTQEGQWLEASQRRALAND
jgi:hypothetical protein